MSRGKFRAVLHNAAGVQIASLAEDEVVIFEFRAKRGELERFTKTQRGRLVLVFQLKDGPSSTDRKSRTHGPIRPGTPPALTSRDADGIAGASHASRAQVERWFGWGLL